MQALEFWKTVTMDGADLLEGLIGLLNDQKVRYCVIGGQAVNAYAERVVSLDLDLVVATDEASPSAGPERGGSQIVVSPLFRDFSVDEMVAVIQGLSLLSFARGDVILREGEPGDRLYMLTSGMVRAFRRDGASGRQLRVADLKEGAFFGEVSILTGGPRTATVAALTPCELLELDRPTLDSIRETHPHVWEVLEDFARQRTAKRD